jgi:hypothetical protein
MVPILGVFYHRKRPLHTLSSFSGWRLKKLKKKKSSTTWIIPLAGRRPPAVSDRGPVQGRVEVSHSRRRYPVRISPSHPFATFRGLLAREAFIVESFSDLFV